MLRTTKLLTALFAGFILPALADDDDLVVVDEVEEEKPNPKFNKHGVNVDEHRVTSDGTRK
jgi:hypothetical protein